MNHPGRLLGIFSGAALAALLAAPSLRAQDGDPQAFQQTVARVAFVQGEGSFQRGDDPDRWQPLAVNVPMTIGDRVWTGASARVELQAPGLRTFVAPRTELTALNLTEDVQQYSIAEGTASFRLVSMDDDDVFEIDTPNAAITLERTGLYRVSVDEDGNTRVFVRRGEARVAAGGGEVSLRSGELMSVNGLDNPEYDVYALPLADSWDRWVDSRERRRHQIVSYDYTSPDVVGAEDLDTYGTWEDVPEYGRVWRPTTVGVDWAPYRVGHWIWQDPWGWTWVSDEPWGWAPYHYGRWVVVRSGWCWVPVGREVRHVAYAPALVAFVGGGPGWSVSASVGGYVGWFPLGPRDPFLPWWGRHGGVTVNVTNVTYVNRAYATVVERSVFAGARPVNTTWVRDTRIVRDVQRAPVLSGPLPVVPTRESLRPTAAERIASQPSAATLARPIAARLAPPPAPPSFERKVEMIRENRGAPVAPAAASALVVRSREGARAAATIRPVFREDRRVDLAPRHDAQGAPPPDPVHVGSRTVATGENPLIPHPSASRENVDRERIAPGAVVTPAARELAEPTMRGRAPRREVVRESTPPTPPPPPVWSAPVPEVRSESPVFSRAPRRIAEQGPDPLGTERRPAVRREEARPAPREEAKPAREPERREAPARVEPKRESKREDRRD